MDLASCVAASATYLQLACGYYMQPNVPKILLTVVVAAYQPAKGCNRNVEGMEYESACRAVPKPRDRFYERCFKYDECPVVYRAKYTNWGSTPMLPPITVYEQKPRKKVRANRVAVATASKTGASTPGPSKAEQIADQLTRQGFVMGAQMGGAAAGTAIVPGIGTLFGGWLGCSWAVQTLLEKDFAAKERWDLHPEIRAANQWHTAVGCSLVGFIQRTIEAPTGRDRAVALAGGLVFVPIPLVSAAGQLAPAANAAVSNLQMLGEKLKRKK